MHHNAAIGKKRARREETKKENEKEVSEVGRHETRAPRFVGRGVRQRDCAPCRRPRIPKNPGLVRFGLALRPRQS